MRRTFVVALVLTAFTTVPMCAGTVTVMPGETLSELADRYGVSLSSLMRLNKLRNPDIIKAGTLLMIPTASNDVLQAGNRWHAVQTGDTLSTIATLYNIGERDLISLNKLRDANYINLGQALSLPSTALSLQTKLEPTARRQPTPIKPNPGATNHILARGQTITQVARAYRIPVSTLISINGIKNPDRLNVGTNLLLRAPVDTHMQPKASSRPKVETKVSTQVSPNTNRSAVATGETLPSSIRLNKVEWRTYGPLQVDWANWQSMGGSYVAPTLNSKGQPLYLAINCPARKINVTGANGNWKNWSLPSLGFERDLLRDRCKNSDS